MKLAEALTVLAIGATISIIGGCITYGITTNNQRETKVKLACIASHGNWGDVAEGADVRMGCKAVDR